MSDDAGAAERAARSLEPNHAIAAIDGGNASVEMSCPAGVANPFATGGAGGGHA
ncbi:glutamate--cysteine ligase, partial [Xanthomonas perforans]